MSSASITVNALPDCALSHLGLPSLKIFLLDRNGLQVGYSLDFKPFGVVLARSFHLKSDPPDTGTEHLRCRTQLPRGC